MGNIWPAKRPAGRENEMELLGGCRTLHVVMAYPATRILGVACGLALFASTATAQEPKSAPPGSADSSTTSPMPPAADAARKPERVVSPHVAGLLAAATPRFAVAVPSETESGTPSPVFLTSPANEIMRLPNFVVREPRVPTPEAVRTRRGLQVYAMNKYLGDADGFSRGVLNHYTLAAAWKKYTKHVPVLNWFEWATSPEKRALDMYYDDEVRKKMRDLSELMLIRELDPARSAGQPPAKTTSATKAK